MNAPSDSAWRVGVVIEDLYEVGQVIESGGMGVVHRVHHRGWNMDLAVKTPRPELVSSPQQITDFGAEAEAWVGLGMHSHIVACVYVRRLDGLLQGDYRSLFRGFGLDLADLHGTIPAVNPVNLNLVHGPRPCGVTPALRSLAASTSRVPR